MLALTFYRAAAVIFTHHRRPDSLSSCYRYWSLAFGVPGTDTASLLLPQMKSKQAILLFVGPDGLVTGEQHE
ncbi:hypothetical protein DYI26_06545 [Halomonas litopenaei]|nr:hypothetical protein [Halomonas litopenaei]